MVCFIQLLENRTKASQREMDTLEMLEDLKEVRRKQERVNTEELLASYRTKHQKTEDELLEEESKALQEEFRYVRCSAWIEIKLKCLQLFLNCINIGVILR